MNNKISKSREPLKSEDGIDFHKAGYPGIGKPGPLSFFALVNMDPFIRNLLNAIKESSKLPMKVHAELIKEKRQRLTKIPRSDLFQAIKPLISNTELTWSLVDRFFESELFNSCSIFQREDFTKVLINYIGPKGFPAIRSTADEPFDLIFLGTLLVILRISSWSLYNCGYENTEYFYPFGTESIDLARQCYDEVKEIFHFHKIPLLQFILILDFYRSNCPEDTDYVDGIESSTTYITAYKLAISAGLHVYCPMDYMKRIWYHILDLDTNQFLKDGACAYMIRDTSFTIELSQDSSDAIAYIRTRHYARELAKPLMLAISDVCSKQTVDQLDPHIRKLEEYLADLSLTSIFEIPNKSVKTAKFLNFLDISSLSYMVLYHIFINYTGVNSSLAFETIGRLLTISAQVLQITHFFDSSRQHDFNLHKQFGSSFTLIPKILQTLHKFVQLQVSLVGRSRYLIPLKTGGNVNETFHEIRRISYQNSRLIISNFGKISNHYFYAKRMNRIQTILIINVFGTSYDSPISQEYLKLLDQEHQVVDSKVLKDLLTELNPTTKEFVESPSDDILDMILDPESLEELDKLLNTQSFLF